MAGQNGGSRPGAGRKKGGTNRAKAFIEDKVREAAAQISDTLTEEQIRTIMPLDVMLFAMRAELRKQELRAASAIADKAAPYLHAKLAPKADPDATDEQRAVVVKVIGGLPER